MFTTGTKHKRDVLGDDFGAFGGEFVFPGEYVFTLVWRSSRRCVGSMLVRSSRGAPNTARDTRTTA